MSQLPKIDDQRVNDWITHSTQRAIGTTEPDPPQTEGQIHAEQCQTYSWELTMRSSLPDLERHKRGSK